jgi:hypothetical protein
MPIAFSIALTTIGRIARDRAGIGDDVTVTAAVFPGARHIGPGIAAHSAVIAVGDIIRGKATTMAYAECFGLLGAVLLCAVLAVAMLRRGMVSGGAAH